MRRILKNKSYRNVRNSFFKEMQTVNLHNQFPTVDFPFSNVIFFSQQKLTSRLERPLPHHCRELKMPQLSPRLCTEHTDKCVRTEN